LESSKTSEFDGKESHLRHFFADSNPIRVYSLPPPQIITTKHLSLIHAHARVRANAMQVRPSILSGRQMVENKSPKVLIRNSSSKRDPKDQAKYL
jgi:hypothetical protein